MNRLQLNIEPSFESHDFQVRIIIDEIDIFPKLLGLDPIYFFKQELYKENSTLIVARCECGIIGCFDTTCKLTLPESSIIKWEISNSQEYVFSSKEYLQTIKDTENDKSWETFERQTERLIGSELVNYKYKNEFTLDWVSLRNTNNQIKISYSKMNPNGYTDQEIIKVNWNGSDQEDAIMKIKKLRTESGQFKKYQ